MAEKEWPKGDPETMTLQDILYEIQQRLTVPKSLTNSFGGYHYRNIEQINRHVKDILADYPGVILRYHDEILIKEGWRYIISTCSLIRGDECISETGLAREQESKSKFDEAQITGSTCSYARKYAAQALFAIDGEPDMDEIASQPQDAPRPVQRQQRQNYPQPTYQQGGRQQVPNQSEPWY